MRDIITKKYEEFIELPFPQNLKGEEISGIDLILLDNDFAALTDKFISFKGHLKIKDIEILKRCLIDLETVIKELSGLDKQYFETSLNITIQVLKYINKNKI